MVVKAKACFEMVPVLDQKTSTTSLNDKAYQYKLVLLGESAVGKSSLVLRFVKNVFSANQESTIGGKDILRKIGAKTNFD